MYGMMKGAGLLVFAGMLASTAPGAALVPESVVTSVAAEPLTEKAFKPFGQIVALPEGEQPTFENATLRFWGGVAKTRIHESIEFAFFTAKKREHEIAGMDRHARTPCLLVGLSGDFFIAVAPPPHPQAGKARPEAARVRVFVVKQGQGVLLHKGTWHESPYPKGEEGVFMTAFRDGTMVKDLVRRAFKGGEVVKF
jgi:ureidoglycolate lyase